MLLSVLKSMLDFLLDIDRASKTMMSIYNSKNGVINELMNSDEENKELHGVALKRHSPSVPHD